MYFDCGYNAFKLSDCKHIFIKVLQQSKAKSYSLSKNIIEIKVKKKMCFDCSITSDVCVRYIHRYGNAKRFFYSCIRYVRQFIILNKSEQRDCT